MTRMWVVLGDATSSGGRVVSGSPFTDIDGQPAALVDAGGGAGTGAGSPAGGAEARACGE